MKFLFFIPVLGFALLSISCRVTPPIDPMTLRPSERCTPVNPGTVYYSGK